MSAHIDHLAGATPEAPPAVASLLTELQANSRRVWTPLRYRVGLVLVTCAMVLLPVIYLALIAVVALIVVAHATSNTGLLVTRVHHPRVIALSLALYLAPIVGGLITIFFMFKPLLARPAHSPARLELDTRQQPWIFQVASALARAVRAPKPASIAVTCDANASASFRPGLWGFLRGQLVLTIGLPLVVGMDTRQLTGILAHELGHFTQGGAMRLAGIVRRINAWFARVALGRDRWDEWLDSAGGDNVIVKLCIAATRGLVWVSRQVLVALMHLGHLISSMMLRLMERDADRRAARIAGAEAFVAGLVRLPELSFAQELGLEELEGCLADRELPDDLPGRIVAIQQDLPPEGRRRIQAQALQSRARWFDSHPAPSERIALVRKNNDPGVIRTSAPATELFVEFTRLCKRATRFTYEHHAGLDLREYRLVPQRQPGKQSTRSAEAPAPVVTYFGHPPIPLLGPLLTRESLRSQESAAVIRDGMLVARATMRRQARPNAEAVETVEVTLDRYLRNLAAAVLVESGYTLNGPSFGLSRTDRASVDEAIRKARAGLENQVAALTPARELVAVRLGAALQLAQNPHVRARLKNPEELLAELPRIVAVAERSKELWERWLELKGAEIRIEHLLHHVDQIGGRGLPGLAHRTTSNLQRWTQVTVESLDRLREVTSTLVYPFASGEPRPTVADVLVPRRPAADSAGAVLDAAGTASTGLNHLAVQAIEKLVAVAMEVETLIDEASAAATVRPAPNRPKPLAGQTPIT